MAEHDDEPLYPTFPILVFKLSDQQYALPLSHVQQIVDMVLITRLPDLPAPLEGVIDVHGRLSVAIDMRARLGLPHAPYQLHTPLLLVELGGRPAALVVDEVVDVREVSSADLEVPDNFLAGTAAARPRFITSVGKSGGDLVLLLDASQLLSLEEAAPLEAALHQAPQDRA
jgi:purine-binding chemotaxis protein CheW